MFDFDFRLRLNNVRLRLTDSPALRSSLYAFHDLSDGCERDALRLDFGQESREDQKTRGNDQDPVTRRKGRDLRTVEVLLRHLVGMED